MSAKVHFIWVGQGDCTLIQTDTNKLILIDCGTSDDFSIYDDNVKPSSTSLRRTIAICLPLI